MWNATCIHLPGGCRHETANCPIIASMYAGRVVIITGGSRGLGLLMARQLRKEGARLVLLARNCEELRRAKAELDGNRGNVLAIVCDVTDRQHVEHAVESTLQHFGRIDVLVNNAGIIQSGRSNT